jgi:hypothetical protein
MILMEKGSALIKFSQTYHDLGEAKLKMDHNVIHRFHQPFNNILNQLISNAVVFLIHLIIEITQKCSKCSFKL